MSGRLLYVRLKGGDAGKGSAGKWTETATGGHLLGHGVGLGVADDVMAGEGIETILSPLGVMPTCRRSLRFSANHLAVLMLSPTLRRLYLARDGDAADRGAVEVLADRARSAGMETVMLGELGRL